MNNKLNQIVFFLMMFVVVGCLHISNDGMTRNDILSENDYIQFNYLLCSDNFKQFSINPEDGTISSGFVMIGNNITFVSGEKKEIAYLKCDINNTKAIITSEGQDDDENIFYPICKTIKDVQSQKYMYEIDSRPIISIPSYAK